MLIKEFVRDYVCIDIETTGLAKNIDEIIEIAIVVVENNTIVETFDTLLKPSAPISDFIARLTGITNDMLLDAPKLDDHIRRKIKRLIGDRVILGHNVKFDINFVDAHICQIENDHVDTLSISRRCIPTLRRHRLVDLSDYFNIEREHHRALSDVMTTIDVFNSLNAFAMENRIDIATYSNRKK